METPGGRTHGPVVLVVLGAAVVGAAFLLPWAATRTVVYGDTGVTHVHAWERLPVIAVVILAAVVMSAGVAATIQRSSRPGGPGTAVVSLGMIAVLGLITWTAGAMAAVDPAMSLEGFESSRTLPSMGTGLALLGALTIIIAGLLARIGTGPGAHR